MMKLNPRILLRLSTNLTLWLILLCGVGMVLWLIDTVLKWDILPDFIDLYVELILSVFAVITGLSILLSLICIVAIGGEFLASKTQLPDHSISPKANKRILIVIGSLVLLIFTFYGISNFRQNVKRQANIARAESKYKRMSYELDSALSSNFDKIESSLIHYVDQMKDHKSNLAEMIVSLQGSLPYHPKVEILIPCEEPYKYQILDVSTYKEKPVLDAEKLLSLPTAHENLVLKDIIETGSTLHSFKKDGAFFSSSRPYAWKKTSGPNQSFVILMVRSK